MIISFRKIDFQTNMIFHYYTVEMHFWKKYFFILNINEITCYYWIYNEDEDED